VTTSHGCIELRHYALQEGIFQFGECRTLLRTQIVIINPEEFCTFLKPLALKTGNVFNSTRHLRRQSDFLKRDDGTTQSSGTANLHYLDRDMIGA
jgi:hypothetical protein